MTRTQVKRAQWRGLVPVCALLVVAGCASSVTAGPAAESQVLSAEVRAMLGTTRSSPEYHRFRNRLREMGPEVDVILIGLVGDNRARPEARADALLLLADRQSPLALATLESALGNSNERLRSAAVIGLRRLQPPDEHVTELIRSATSDRSRTVRMNALQSLEVRDVQVIRDAVERETDPELRQVATQLILFAEARGGPLEADERGALRTWHLQGQPQIVFRAGVVDPTRNVATGDLRIEMPEGPDIPLTNRALVVHDVVPAFFSPDRAAVAFEADGEIQVVNVDSRAVRSVGRGMAPRPLPFTHQLVYLRERARVSGGGLAGTQVVYDVHLTAFGPDTDEVIGELTARLDPAHAGGETPVRWMVVAETADGFVLTGQNIEPFRLPTPIWTPGARTPGRQDR